MKRGGRVLPVSNGQLRLREEIAAIIILAAMPPATVPMAADNAN